MHTLSNSDMRLVFTRFRYLPTPTPLRCTCDLTLMIIGACCKRTVVFHPCIPLSGNRTATEERLLAERRKCPSALQLSHFGLSFWCIIISNSQQQATPTIHPKWPSKYHLDGGPNKYTTAAGDLSISHHTSISEVSTTWKAVSHFIVQPS